ncbi:MAG: nucleotidyltransferase family protein [Aestuariibacter sp.]
MSHCWKNVVIGPDSTIKEALKIINDEALRVALVADEHGKLLGMVTDGDVRRGLLRDISLTSKVAEIMNQSPLTASRQESRKELVEIMEEKDILAIPIVENGFLVDLETLHDALLRPKLENPVFLMAGGFGKRLRPLTDNCPKPMLVVGEKPILETVLTSFSRMGFVNFFISTHYMAEQIEQHFGDGSTWGVNIQYVHEDSPLGTGGALGLLPDDMPDLPIVMMNGDVLTNVDFLRLLDFHNETKADLSVCVREFEYQVPYGVIENNEDDIVALTEKPIHRYFVNAGIYVVNQAVAKNIYRGQVIDMPDLIEQKISCNGAVKMFPVHEYWLDIGRLDDYKRAQVDIRSLRIGE